ncbi:THAP domain-containing protein 1-like [Sardina pilchardus]|uniref:THAP domain-containing protein 1-like n=1 Tax=Sardina pilchardus TaxID=27697 RepID=UPI002E1377C1
MPCCVAVKCSNRTGGSSKISFFKFPFRDPERLKQWIRNVNRVDWYPTKYSSLCSDHFAPDCFKPNFRAGLTGYAVPTIFYPRHISKPKPRTTRNSLNIKISHPSAGVPAEIHIVNHDHDYLSFVVRADPVTTEEQVAINGHPVPQNSLGLQNSPGRLQAQLLNVKTKLVSSRRTVRIEQQRVRRLRKKVKSLSSLATDLKKKLLFSNSCNGIMEGSFGGVAKEILTRSKCKSKSAGMSEALKSFSTTLYALSPKAYRFVRQSFDSFLPHPTTVKTWCRPNSKNGSSPKPDTQVREDPNSGSNMVVASVTPNSSSVETFAGQPTDPSWVLIPASQMANG